MQRAGAMNLLSFLLNDMTEENRKLKLIIFPGETVVIGKYFLIQKGEKKPDGYDDYETITFRESLIGYLMRIETKGEDDYKNVHNIQDSIKLTPLYKEKLRKNEYKPENIDPVIYAKSLSDKEFYELYGRLLKDNPALDNQVYDILAFLDYDSDNGILNYPVSLLSTKQADAYVSPLTTVNLLSGMGLGNVFDDSTKYQLNDSQAVVAVRNAYLKNNEAAAIAVNKALIRAYKSAVENPDIFYTALESANLPKSIVKTGYAWNAALSQLNPELTSRAISNLDNLKNWAKKNNLISTDINIDSIVNNSYYEKAKEDIK